MLIIKNDNFNYIRRYQGNNIEQFFRFIEVIIGWIRFRVLIIIQVLYVLILKGRLCLFLGFWVLILIFQVKILGFLIIFEKFMYIIFCLVNGYLNKWLQGRIGEIIIEYVCCGFVKLFFLEFQ